MRLFGLILVLVAAACFVLPVCRDILPFRIALSDSDSMTSAVVLGLAGIVSVAASWV